MVPIRVANRVAIRRQWQQTLEEYVYPIIGHKLPGDVTTADVIAILKQELKDKADKPIVGTTLWNTMPETASRVRGRIEKIIAAWKVESDQQDKFNPAQWAGHLQAVFPAKSKVRKVGHHPALPHAEVLALTTRLAGQPGMAALALRFLILTAGRTGEVVGARWLGAHLRKDDPDEIDLDKHLWSIPEERMKVGQPHVVPLSDAALAVLAEAGQHKLRPGERPNDAVFPGGTWVDDHHAILSNMALLALLRRMKVEVTAHGALFQHLRQSQSRKADAIEMPPVISCALRLANRKGSQMAKKKILRQSPELPPGTPFVLDVAQACTALTIRETKLYELVRAEALAAYKLGDRLVFKPKDVADFIASLPPAKIKPIRRSRRPRLG
jgi:integrase